MNEPVNTTSTSPATCCSGSAPAPATAPVGATPANLEPQANAAAPAAPKASKRGARKRQA